MGRGIRLVTIMGLAICCCFNSEDMASRLFPTVIREGECKSGDICAHSVVAG